MPPSVPVPLSPREEHDAAFPLAIAHRAGNDLRAIGAAARAGVDLVEADIWLWRGRIEVRHLKTMGRVPLLWDRWLLAPGWLPRLQLPELLLASRAAGVQLMLDLKGGDRRLTTTLLGLIDDLVPNQPLFVCSRSWSLLEPFLDAPAVRVVHSAGSPAQLRALRPRLHDGGGHSMSIHQRLLDPATVRELRRYAPLLMSWPVNSIARMDELLAWGVTGIISDTPHVLRELLRRKSRLPLPTACCTVSDKGIRPSWSR